MPILIPLSNQYIYSLQLNIRHIFYNYRNIFKPANQSCITATILFLFALETPYLVSIILWILSTKNEILDIYSPHVNLAFSNGHF